MMRSTVFVAIAVTPFLSAPPHGLLPHYEEPAAAGLLRYAFSDNVGGKKRQGTADREYELIYKLGKDLGDRHKLGREAVRNRNDCAAENQPHDQSHAGVGHDTGGGLLG